MRRRGSPRYWGIVVGLGVLVLVLLGCGLGATSPPSSGTSSSVPTSSVPTSSVPTSSVGSPIAPLPHSPQLSLSQSPPIQPPAQTPTPRSATPAPIIDRTQLQAHIQALTQAPRHSLMARRRTRAYLKAHLQRWGWVVQEQPFPTGINVVAVPPNAAPKPPGTAAPTTLLLGAHFDTVPIAPGADDNGTGVATLLEVARLYGSSALTSNGAKVPDLRLVFFDREEAGLEGSMAYVAKPENQVGLRGAIILDMVGVTCRKPGCQRYPQGISPASLGLATMPPQGDFLAVIGEAESLQLLNRFKPKIDEAHEAHEAQIKGQKLPAVLTLAVPFRGLLQPDTLRSDHAPFWLQGIPAVLVTDTANLRNPHYHRSGDRPETLDWDFFTGAAQRVVNVIHQM